MPVRLQVEEGKPAPDAILAPAQDPTRRPFLKGKDLAPARRQVAAVEGTGRPGPVRGDPFEMAFGDPARVGPGLDPDPSRPAKIAANKANLLAGLQLERVRIVDIIVRENAIPSLSLHLPEANAEAAV